MRARDGNARRRFCLRRFFGFPYARTSVNRVHLGTGVKVDLFIKGTSEFDDSEFAPRVLLRFRLGGGASDRQWSDVCGIVGVQAGNLDAAYLAQWADRLGIRDLLDRLMGEV